ncbi:TPA: hypothetical protein ACPVZG_000622 [Vibrio parahaemolyticus]
MNTGIREINDVFLMPEDGKPPQYSKAKNMLIIAIGADGQFYSLKKAAQMTEGSLKKAMTFAETTATDKKINSNSWQSIDSEFVKRSYPYSDFAPTIY